MTDIELSETFSSLVNEDYKIALEYNVVHPDFSLMKYREVITQLCKDIAKDNRLAFKSNKLQHQIDHLYMHNIITDEFKDILHQARILGNSGVHKPESPKDDEEKSMQNALRDKLLKNAKQARNLVVEAFVCAYPLYNNGEEAPSFKYVEIMHLNRNQILLDSVTSASSKNKLKAGLLYEKLAGEVGEDIIGDELFIMSYDHDYHKTSLYKLAAAQYEAAYKLSARIDNRLKVQPILNVSQIVEKYCDTEALFRYASIISEGLVGSEYQEEGRRLLKVAADRGHTLASAYYGASLYLVKQDFIVCEKYLLSAADNDIALAHRFLCLYYSEGIANEKNDDMAFYHIQEAISLECLDSLALLGEAYHKGTFVDKNDVKAEEILKTAIDKGSLRAKRYYHLHFKGLIKEMAKVFQSKAMDFIESTKRKPLIKEKKIGRNEDCICGSGKKYKYCCGKR